MNIKGLLTSFITSFSILSVVQAAQVEMQPNKVQAGAAVNVWNSSDHDCGDDNVCPDATN